MSGLVALHFKLGDWLSLGKFCPDDSQGDEDPDQQHQDSDAFHPSRCSKRQVTLISWMWWLTRCCRYPFMGFTFLLCKTSSLYCSLLVMKDCQEELLIMARESYKTGQTKKSKVLNSCAG